MLLLQQPDVIKWYRRLYEYFSCFRSVLAFLGVKSTSKVKTESHLPCTKTKPSATEKHDAVVGAIQTYESKASDASFASYWYQNNVAVE